MNRLTKGFLLAALLLLTTVVRGASQKDSIMVMYDFGAVFVHTDFMENKAELDAGISRVNESKKQGLTVSRVTIRSSASPEGTEKTNESIARLRAESLCKYLSEKIGFPVDSMTIDSRRVDWRTLKKVVAEDSRMSKERKLNSFLDGLDQQIARGEKVNDISVKKRLRSLVSASGYQYIRKHLYPKMRYARAMVEMEQAKKTAVQADVQQLAPQQMTSAVLSKEDTVRVYAGQERVVSERVVSVKEYWLYPDGSKVEITAEEPADTVAVAQQQQRPTVKEQLQLIEALKEQKNLYLALKTNLLADALAVPNVSLEWAFSDKWSVSGEYMHAWWKTDRTHRYWRTYGGNIELRYWFGKQAAKKRLTGHHVGAYFGALTYDFEWGGRGYQAHKWSKNFGLSYGYSLPIARRLSMDFEVGVGYFTGEYEEYVPRGDYYFWEATKNRKWFGPTRLGVSLVWLLGHGNNNHK